MPITTVRCHVLGVNVRCVTDFEGKVIRMICPECEEPTGVCRRKIDALRGGPLSQLLERVEEETLADRGTRCDLR